MEFIDKVVAHYRVCNYYPFVLFCIFVFLFLTWILQYFALHLLWIVQLVMSSSDESFFLVVLVVVGMVFSQLDICINQLKMCFEKFKNTIMCDTPLHY